MKEREKLGSRLGFILISAGCAIGIGNVWKFPYMAGQGGGGTFVLFYLIFLALLGLPVMTMEFSVGRASQKSPVKAYYALEKPGQKWHIHGYITLIGCYLLMMFYTTVTGWMLNYFYMTATGKFQGLDSDGVAGQFTNMLGQPVTMGFWMIVVVIAGVFVCSRGLQNGLEKVTKVMMISLLVIMVVLAINSFTMDGAKEGLKFYLIPDFERMKEIGIISTITGAMNQAFFTLSLGIGAMAIFGSYIGKDHALLGESMNIALLDTSSISFMQTLQIKGVRSESVLKVYDLILIPQWVLMEINDAPGRANYVQGLIEQGYPIYSIEEKIYSDLANNEEGNLYKIVLASTRQLGRIRSYYKYPVEFHVHRACSIQEEYTSPENFYT